MQSALNRLDPEAGERLAPTVELLTTGGDARLALDATGRNAYGCRPMAEEGVAAFGSSTASTISRAGFAAAERRREDLLTALGTASGPAVYARETQRIRGALLTMLRLDDLAGLQVVLAASGTDLHLLIAQLVATGTARPLLSIIGGAAETGSGVPAALTGRRAGDPPAGGAREGEVVEVRARAPDGGLRDTATVNAEVEALADAAAADGRRVLLVVADVSKTGLITPGLDCALSIKRRYPHQVDVLIDACQFRLRPATLRAYLERGLMVAATGSKFLAGPSFCGALFVPVEVAERLQEHVLPGGLRAHSSRADWPAHWCAAAAFGSNPNFGLVLRWSAAIEHLRAFSALPDRAIAVFLERFKTVVAEEVWRRPALQLIPTAPLDRTALGVPAGWDALPTIFAFALRHEGGRLFDPVETALVHRLLRTNLTSDWPGAEGFGPASHMRLELGQPVTFGRPGGERAAALRLCVSAPMIVEALESEACTQAVLDRARCALAKAAWAAEVAATA